MGAPLLCEIHRGLRKRVRDPAAPVAGADEDAGHRPDVFVGLVLIAALPGNAKDAQEPDVCRAWLHRAPADRHAVEIGDEP